MAVLNRLYWSYLLIIEIYIPLPSENVIHNICNLVVMLTKHFSVNLLDVHTKLLFLVPVSGRAIDGIYGDI